MTAPQTPQPAERGDFRAQPPEPAACGASAENQSGRVDSAHTGNLHRPLAERGGCAENHFPPAKASPPCGCPAQEDREPAERWLLPGERLDDLQAGGMRLIQRADAFRFGTDSVLLADFAAPKPRERTVDLGCGTGAIATLMAAHCPELEVDAVEIQPDVADMARRSTLLNGLSARVRVYAMDLREAWRTLGAERYRVAVCNPPYGRAGSGLLSRRGGVRAARHEVSLTPDELALAASKLLCAGGKLCVIYPAFRALEMMDAMQAHRLAPKRIRTVHGVAGRAPRFVLLDAVKDGGPGLHWLPPLVLQAPDGAPTAEWRRIYRMDGE